MTVAHLASTTVQAPLDFVFAHLSTPAKVGRWALGCMDLKPSDEPNVWCGRSLFDDALAYVEIRAQAELSLIDYWVGANPGSREARISVRVHHCAPCSGGPAICMIAMLAWRSADMSDERWQRLQKTHELEVLLIKSHIERDFPIHNSLTLGAQT